MRGERTTLWTRGFVLVTLSALAYFTSYAMMIPVLPDYVVEGLGGGNIAVGVTAGAFAVTALVLRPYAGILGDRKGRRILIMAGTAAVAATVLGLVWAGTLPAVIALRLVSGVGEAFFFVGAASAITDMAPPERRGEALSLFSIALYTGVAAGPFLAEVLLDRFGYDTTFVVSAALSAAASLLALPTPDLRPEGAVSPRLGLRRILHPAGIFPGAIMVTSVVGFAGFMAFVRVYAREELAMSGVRALLLMYGAILVSIRWLGARVPDRLGATKAGSMGLTLSATGLAVVGLWGSPAGLFTGAAIFACGQALAFPAYMALAASRAPAAERGAAVGTTTAFIDFGFFVGPLLFGAVAVAFDRQAAFLAGSVVAVIGLAMQVFAVRRPAHEPKARLEACERV